MEYENRQFEQNLTQEERSIESLLGDVMQVATPDGLADRVAGASLNALLEGQLDIALSVKTPDGFASRIFDASISSLDESEVVIGRIGQTMVWRQLAMAACVLFAVLIAVRFGNQESQMRLTEQAVHAVTVADVLTVEEEGLLLEDLQLEEYDYLSGTRDLAYAEVAESLNSLRNDVELWQFGLLTE